MLLTFAQTYERMTRAFITNKALRVNFACRGLAMARESAAELYINMDPKGISIFSHPTHRVIPIRFVLAELCWILAGRFDTASIASYNKAMTHFADEDNKEVISGSYGLRLAGQLSEMVLKLKNDIYTRQACVTIFDRTDCLSGKTHMPCNVFLQFLCRPPLLDLHVTSRSSDFVTGFSIDTIHWQAMLIMMVNELKMNGVHVIPSVLHYNIASLHVYEADIPLIDQWDYWKIHTTPFEHFMPMSITLSEAIASAKKHFAANLSLAQLMDILNIGTSLLPKMIELDEMFRVHKNKVVR